MPVKAYFFYHFVVAAALINTVYSVYKYQDIKYNTRGNVTTMETGDGKEVVEEAVCRLQCYQWLCNNHLLRCAWFKEVLEFADRCVHICKCTP